MKSVKIRVLFGSAISVECNSSFGWQYRNIYGFELNPEQVEGLVEKYPEAWGSFESDVRVFLDWLRALAMELDKLGE